MINYENLLNLLEDTDISYFSIVSDSREVFKNIEGDITKISSFFAVQKLVNKLSLEEYTHKKYEKIEQDEDIIIEKESDHSGYKFMGMGTFSNLEDIISTAISAPAMYVFIDSGNTFESISEELSGKEIPNLFVKYRHGKFNLDEKIFSSIENFSKYLMKKYYL